MECNFENCPNFERLGKKFADRISELEQENEKLKEVNKELAHYLACMTEQRNKANTCLQEIKTIAGEDCEFCDDVGGCMDNECRNVRIRDLITKAEEE